MQPDQRAQSVQIPPALTFRFDPRATASMDIVQRRAVHDALFTISEILIGVLAQPRCCANDSDAEFNEAGALLDALYSFIVSCNNALIEMERSHDDCDLALALRLGLGFRSDPEVLIEDIRAIINQRKAIPTRDEND